MRFPARQGTGHGDSPRRRPPDPPRPRSHHFRLLQLLKPRRADPHHGAPLPDQSHPRPVPALANSHTKSRPAPTTQPPPSLLAPLIRQAGQTPSQPSAYQLPEDEPVPGGRRCGAEDRRGQWEITARPCGGQWESSKRGAAASGSRGRKWARPAADGRRDWGRGLGGAQVFAATSGDDRPWAVLIKSVRGGTSVEPFPVSVSLRPPRPEAGKGETAPHRLREEGGLGLRLCLGLRLAAVRFALVCVLRGAPDSHVPSATRPSRPSWPARCCQS